MVACNTPQDFVSAIDILDCILRLSALSQTVRNKADLRTDCSFVVSFYVCTSRWMMRLSDSLDPVSDTVDAFVSAIGISFAGVCETYLKDVSV